VFQSQEKFRFRKYFMEDESFPYTSRKPVLSTETSAVALFGFPSLHIVT
jgi:hypothetical protein